MAHLHGGIDSSLGIEGVEDGLYEEQVDTPFGERIHLFGIRLEELVVGDGAGTGVGHVGTHRARFVGGSHRTSHPPGMLVAGEFIGHLTCQPCPLKGDGTGEVGQLVVGL